MIWAPRVLCEQLSFADFFLYCNLQQLDQFDGIKGYRCMID